MDAQLSAGAVAQERRAKAKEKEPETPWAAEREAAAARKRAVPENQLIPDKSPLALALGLSCTSHPIGVIFQVSSERVGTFQKSRRRF